jgi:predicted aspartyl protease
MSRRLIGGLFFTRLGRRLATPKWILFVPAWLPCLQSRADDVPAIIAHMRSAAGSAVLENLKTEILFQGRSTKYESACEYTLRFAPTGKFLQRLQGPMPESSGFDGVTCWSVGESGVPRTLELFDRDLSQLWFGLQTGYWLAHLTPEAVSLVTQDNNSNQVVLLIKQGRLKVKLYVSRTTWLPLSLQYSRPSGEQTWTFADYRNDLGWRYPGKISVGRAGRVTDTYEVLKAVKKSDDEATVYKPVRSTLNNTSFNAGVSAKIEVKRAATGHVLVHPKFDGKDLGWLIFDTGASGATVLDPTAVAKLNVTPLGSAPATTILGTARTRIVRANSLEIGPLTLANPLLTELDMGPIRNAIGAEIVGIIGFDLLSRCVAEITLSENCIKLFDSAHDPAEALPWQKLTFNHSLPLVPATFEGDRKGFFRLDVGASGEFTNVVFHSPTVDSMQLLKGRDVTKIGGSGMHFASGKIAWFELAGHRFENPEVVFALDHKGPFADEYVEGNLGVEFLKPFRIVLDFPHERVALIDLTKN